MDDAVEIYRYRFTESQCPDIDFYLITQLIKE